jgi:Concanavalin A-like lectin/glucanases superfamily
VRKALLVALAAAVSVPCAFASGPIGTAVYVPNSAPFTMQRIREAGATFARINVSWASVAPNPPTSFPASNPADPGYHWGKVDAEVKSAVEQGLTPYLTVYDAPLWAQKDEPHPTHLGPFPIASWKPEPRYVADFARTLALRYDGTFAGLPRVRYFEVWNESNLSQYLSPQLENGKVVSGDLYRALLNAFASAVHAVHADNVVVAASLSAFSFLTPYGRLGISPMLFMRKLLCMSAGRAPKPTCNAVSELDALSIHPWTSGGPTHHASEKGDISLGDLPALRRLLAAATKARHIRPNRMPQLWVTEFAWDTRPPDTHPDAAPIELQSRWVAEALHRAWQNDVRVFTWLMLWDQIYPWEPLQSGLFFRNGENFADARPKPTFYAFRFPFVAYREGGKIALWGKTPYGRSGRVAVQQRTATRWRWVGTFDANRNGIFEGTARYRKPKSSRAKSPARPSSAAETYRNFVMSGKPMSYWPLGERSGSVATDAIHWNDGVYTGGVRLGVKGPLAQTTAVVFNGKTARVRLGLVSSVHTVELWVKTRTRSDAVAFSNRDTIHRFSAVGTYGGLAHSYDGYGIIGDAVGNGSWHHLVYTYDSPTSTGRLYVDGRLSQFAVYPRSEGGAPGNIGYDADLGSYFRGAVAQVAVYSYVLTPEQIRSHYLASGRRLAPSVELGSLRAVELGSGSASVPFSLVRPPDRYVLPFGGGGYDD